MGSCGSKSSTYVEPFDTTSKGEHGKRERLEFISKVTLFKPFHSNELSLLAKACIESNHKSGDVVIKQGDTGNEFFIILAGEASVSIETNGSKKVVATLKKGDYFGEAALLHDEPRAASIVASKDLKLLSLSQEQFREAGLINKVHFAHRKAVGGRGKRDRGNLGLAFKPAISCGAKTDEERKFLVDSLKSNDSLNNLFDIDDDQVNELVDTCWKEDVPEDKILIKQGDIDADFYYVVDKGNFDISIAELAENSTKLHSAEGKLRRSRSVKTVSRGGGFGEMALFFLAPRAATVKALEDSTVWVFDRYNFKRILMKVAESKQQEYADHMAQIRVLKPLWDEERLALVEVLTEIHYFQDETIVEQGDVSNSMLILISGEVIELKDGKEVNRVVADKVKGTKHTFGEQALVDNVSRPTALKVASEMVEILALDRESFNLVLGPMESIMASVQLGSRRSSNLKDTSMPPTSSQDNMTSSNSTFSKSGKKKMNGITLAELSRIGLLGCGGFGLVELYAHKKTGETYALKGLSKGYIVKAGMQHSVMNEKSILLRCKSPFIIQLHGTYNDAKMLYFLLEPALGGELFVIYRQQGFHGSEEHARFYVASVICAFEHLHAQRIIYRDLKPENIILKDTGQSKITDMGLAKYVVGKTSTTCGTIDYFAPEMIQSGGYNQAVDWWTLGVLLFELICGYPPFAAANYLQTYQKILDGIGRVNFPPKCKGQVVGLIKSLLKSNPSDRPPMLPGGLHNLMKAQWYASFDWAAFKNLKMTPPFVPKVKHRKDISNFSNAALDEKPPVEPYQDDGSGWDKDF